MSKHYFINRQRGEEGPFTLDELSNMRLLSDTRVWYEGLSDWKNISDVSELANLVIQRPPIIERTKDTQTNVNKQIYKRKYFNKKSLIYLLLIIIGLTISSIAVNRIFFQPEPVTDIDGNVSSSVNIGSQIWMVNNLDVSHYRNGDPIPQAQNIDEWDDLTTGAWCYFDMNTENGRKYGKLYNWYAVNDTRGLAPKGWHIPSKDEWVSLTDYLGGKDIAGGKMRSLQYWESPNADATNSSGFSGMPGGLLFFRGIYTDLGSSGNWWSSTEEGPETAYCLALVNNSGSIGNQISYNKNFGLSVRCIKD
jgi:uncharacterized protein (TIGR02145 family)